MAGFSSFQRTTVPTLLARQFIVFLSKRSVHLCIDYSGVLTLIVHYLRAA